MVDFGDILNDVMDKLIGQDCDLAIVPIVGMGGMDKTTLAKSIYAHPLIVHHFDILVRVTISQEYSVRDILLRVLSKENNGGEKTEDQELGERVYKMLYGRRYLIVMDDIWSIEAWDKVKAYFPNNCEGSKMMITTRNSNLAFQTSGSHYFQMKCLDDDKSWDLLSSVVFGKECCPIELAEIGKEIARNCRGLPLAIMVIGGLLTKSIKTQEYWQHRLENLNSQINLENNEHCLQILHRSYKELPIHLKPCFLYMGVFPEDSEISVSMLVKLWVAEGFLKPAKNTSSEKVAKEYVKELIERNLIIVDELGWNGKAKSCKIHDLLRDLCLREAKRQRFFCVLRGKDVNNISEDMNTERRICIHDNTGKDFSPQLIRAVESASHIRSLISFVPNGYNFMPPLSFSCRLLRVFVCFYHYGSSYKGIGDAEAISEHANLRCLHLVTDEKAERFFTSLHLFWNLQKLDISNYISPEEVPIAPFEVWKMYHLRHLKFEILELPVNSSGEDAFVLENLHTLSRVLNFKCSEDVVKRIPNIRKLDLEYMRMEEELSLSLCLNNLCLLRNLESLCLNLNKGYSHSNQEGMHNLTLPHSLRKLTLTGTYLLWKELNTKIGSLPLLEVLSVNGNYSVGSKWETVDGQSNSLKFLVIRSCDLKCWRTDGTHFPRLEHLVLEDLSYLEEIPLSIGDIPTLQSIKLLYCSESASASAERIKGGAIELRE